MASMTRAQLEAYRVNRALRLLEEAETELLKAHRSAENRGARTRYQEDLILQGDWLGREVQTLRGTRDRAWSNAEDEDLGIPAGDELATF